ncbi:dual specificity calcium/calmodulin-dependent 3',5'-cyclic nucleotide phosphodiesterase 1C-like isoform X1 [Ciconia boyciana]|uniref:dual specificity calcium/calmodulin-dependent 3',5'-cyclic nucleotide phosphodiesterase 1C-like isoform X1 n=1 Tax=Ciconia boyciana TaxID=52775 RepID=UPI003BA08763
MKTRPYSSSVTQSLPSLTTSIFHMGKNTWLKLFWGNRGRPFTSPGGGGDRSALGATWRLTRPPARLSSWCSHVDKWSFDVFTRNCTSGDHTLKFVSWELLTSYDVISHFKIPVSALVPVVEALEVGYSQHRTPYHNLMHAADVTRMVHYLLFKTGVVVCTGDS